MNETSQSSAHGLQGFFVSTVGINEEIIRRYIQMQGEEDAGQAQLEF